MTKNNKPEYMVIRQKAEELLKNKQSEKEAKLLDADILQLVHELEVYKIELELQYEEFINSKKGQETIAPENYIELYDLEPTGYFTLSRNGEIIQLNNSGAKMLGKDKSQLENRKFHIFLSDNSKPLFLLFLGRVFTSGKNESCELILSTDNDMPVYVYLTGIVSKNSNNCLITVIDITERKLLESTLIEKLILLAETEQAGKIGGWTIDVKTLNQKWTQQTFQIFEIDTTNGEPKVPESIKFIDQPFRQTAEIAIKRAIKFGEPFEQEWKVNTAKGNKRWVNVIGKTKIFKEKTIDLFGSIQDITERKHAEEALQASEKKYHAIYDNVQDIFYQTDLAGTVLDVSPSIKYYSEFNRDEIVGKSVTNLYYDPKDRDNVIGLLKEKGEFRDYELRLKTRTGELMYVSNNARLVFDSEGKPNHIDGAIRDITQRKLAEIDLQASKDFLNSIINAVASPVFVKDRNHKYVLANNAYSLLLKFPLDKIIGSTDGEYFPEEQIKLLIERDNEVFKTGEENTNEEYLTDGTGNVRTVIIRKTLYTDNSDNKFLVGVINDITERKLAEKQIERLNRVNTVLSNINKTIVRVRDKQFLFDEACRIAVQIGGFKLAWIGIVNTETNKIEVVTSSGKTGEYLNSINIDLNSNALNSGPAGQAIKSGKCNFSNNIQTDVRKFYWREKALEFGFHSIIALPVIVWGKTIGVYMIYSGEIDFFNEDEIILLEEMASDISFAIEFIENEIQCKMAEKALRKSEAIQRKIVSNIGDVIVIIDQNGINRYKSPNIETLFGWKAEDLIGYSAWNNVHPDDLVSTQKIVADMALVPNATETAEIRYRRKDGEYVWIEITLVNLLSDPDIQGFLGNYHDISDRRLAQAKIREKDQEFKKLSSNLPDLIFQFTRKPDGTYYVPIASEGIKNIFGCSPEDVINDFTPIGRVIHPDDVKRVIADIEYSAKHLTFFTCEFRVLIPGQPIKWIYSKSAPEKMHDGSVTWYGFNADISERRRVEDSVLKLKTAIDKSEISVVITDKNGKIEYANPFFNKISGYSPEEYIGKNPKILKSSYHPKEFYEELWNTIKSGETWEGELYNCKKNGEMYWENTIISPIAKSNNEITHFVAIKTDITQAKNINSELIIAKERAEESDKLKSAFLANMSHEIRTPLNGILGFTELLKEPDLPDDQRNYFIGIIEKSGDRLLNIINDIIDISKIESGLMKVKNSGINVNEYLNQILTFFNPEAEAKNIKLICKPGLPGEDAFLETDGEKFYAILMNLVKNALKYTETGFVEFGYRVVETQNLASLHAPSPSSHSYIQFYVKDTGIGIPKNRQEAIFERFVQADIVDKMARQGAGLGLSISKAYVEMLGGKLWVESEEENLSVGMSGGSTFHFTLPIPDNSKSETNKRTKILNPANNVQPEVSGLKIIIAEDDETSSTYISIGVRKFGKEVIKVQTGREAVDACRNNPDVDLILMDIQMPEMDGYDATRQIRQFNTEVIIIALTAYALAGDREKAIEVGCNDYISKPVKMADLVEMIQKYFKL